MSFHLPRRQPSLMAPTEITTQLVGERSPEARVACRSPLLNQRIFFVLLELGGIGVGVYFWGQRYVGGVGRSVWQYSATSTFPQPTSCSHAALSVVHFTQSACWPASHHCPQGCHYHGALVSFGVHVSIWRAIIAVLLEI